MERDIHGSISYVYLFFVIRYPDLNRIRRLWYHKKIS